MSFSLSTGSTSSPRSSDSPSNLEECPVVASEILIAAAEVWRYHYRRRGEVMASVVQRNCDRGRAQHEANAGSGELTAATTTKRNLFMFNEEEEDATALPPMPSFGGQQSVEVPSLEPTHTGSGPVQRDGAATVPHPPLQKPKVRGSKAADGGPKAKFNRDDQHMESVLLGDLREDSSGKHKEHIGRDNADLLNQAHRSQKEERGLNASATAGTMHGGALTVSALLEAHYHYHREMQQLLHVRGRRVARIMTNAAEAGTSSEHGIMASLGASAFSNEPVLPFGFFSQFASNIAVSESEDPLTDAALLQFHDVALELVNKHLLHVGSPSRRGKTASSPPQQQSSADSHSTEEASSGDESSRGGRGGPATPAVVESLLLLDPKHPQVAHLHRCRSRHVIDLDHNVYLRLWRSRKDARAFHRGLAALHEAKCLLMLPPSFAVPFSVLVKGPNNTAVSATWLPPLESSHVLTPPTSYTSFTNFFRRAWREAVYPNTRESKRTTVSLCTGADGTYYAMNCGIDEATSSPAAGGIVVTDEMLRSMAPAAGAVGRGGTGAARTADGSPGTAAAGGVSILLDARRAIVFPTSKRHYQQARGMFQRVAQQLKESYETHLMYLSMMSYLQGALFATGSTGATGGGAGTDNLDKAVDSVLEFATSLPKEETPLACALYVACGEIRRLSTVDYVKRMTKKVVNTTIFQPKLNQWQADTRVFSDVCAIMVAHILEGRDDPIALRRNLATKAIANVAVVDICCVWGMNLADAEARYGHSRTLQLFSKAALEIVLVDHQLHHMPVLGQQPPKPLLDAAATDPHPLPAEVAEVAFGILQPLLLGVDARRLTATVPPPHVGGPQSGAIADTTAWGRQGAGGNKSHDHSFSSSRGGSLSFSGIPSQQLRNGTALLAPGDRIIDPVQLGGWVLCYVSPLLHEPHRGNLVHLSRLVRVLRFEADEVPRLLAKAIAILICADAAVRNFFDTTLIKDILVCGIAVINGRCADYEALRTALRFIEGETVAQHREMIVADIHRWLASTAAAEQAAAAEKAAAVAAERAAALLKASSDASELEEEVSIFATGNLQAPLRRVKDQQKKSVTAAPPAASTMMSVKVMKKIDRRIYQFLLDTIVDPVPPMATTDELLRKPYVPAALQPKPSQMVLDAFDHNEAKSASASSSTSDDESGNRTGKKKSRGSRRPPKSKKPRDSKFDVFFRAITLYRDEEHLRGDVERLEGLHHANLQVRFANGLRSLHRRWLLQQRMASGHECDSGDDLPEAPVDDRANSQRRNVPPRGLSEEGLAKWQEEKRAEAHARQVQEQLERRALHGKAARYRKTMLETFPDGSETYSKAIEAWPVREVPSVRFAMLAFEMHEAERRGRAQCLLEEFEHFSSVMVAFDSELWEL